MHRLTAESLTQDVEGKAGNVGNAKYNSPQVREQFGNRRGCGVSLSFLGDSIVPPFMGSCTKQTAHALLWSRAVFHNALHRTTKLRCYDGFVRHSLVIGFPRPRHQPSRRLLDVPR